MGVSSGTLGVVTLISWAITATVGVYMLGALIASGGLHRRRAGRDRLFPSLLFGHFSMAITGMLVWVAFLVTGWAWLAWSAVGLLMPAIGLGISTVTLWTPFPGSRVAPGAGPPGPRGARGAPATGRIAVPAEDMLASRLPDELLSSALDDELLAAKLVDDMLNRLLAGPPRSVRKPKWSLAALIPAGHGIAAVATFFLATLTAAGMS